MTKCLGIDPGTKSFEICGIKDGSVFKEEVIETIELSKNPKLLLEVIEEEMPVDLIAGPSGYGVELTHLESLSYQKLKDWYSTYILLLKKKDLEKSLEKGDKGILVYKAMIEMVLEM